MIAAGLVLLLGGGAWLVSGAVALARRWGLSPMVIGVTLVGMGTSLPELLTSLRAAMQGAPDLALGNVVGSNIANVLLILGLAALIRPVPVPRADLRRDGAATLAVTLAASAWIVVAGGVGHLGGAAFLLLFALWMAWQLRTGAAADEEEGPVPAPLRAAGTIAAGLVGLVAGTELLVRGAIGVAEGFGVSEAVIGLTVVAIGTSLPELATSAVAAWKGRAEVALGNVLGSNVFNLLAILGATGAAVPLAADARFAALDLWVMVGALVAALALSLSGRIGRRGGAALLAGYGLYMATLL